MPTATPRSAALYNAHRDASVCRALQRLAPFPGSSGADTRCDASPALAPAALTPVVRASTSHLPSRLPPLPPATSPPLVEAAVPTSCRSRRLHLPPRQPRLHLPPRSPPPPPVAATVPPPLIEAAVPTSRRGHHRVQARAPFGHPATLARPDRDPLAIRPPSIEAVPFSSYGSSALVSAPPFGVSPLAICLAYQSDPAALSPICPRSTPPPPVDVAAFSPPATSATPPPLAEAAVPTSRRGRRLHLPPQPPHLHPPPRSPPPPPAMVVAPPPLTEAAVPTSRRGHLWLQARAPSPHPAGSSSHGRPLDTRPPLHAQIGTRSRFGRPRSRRCCSRPMDRAPWSSLLLLESARWLSALRRDKNGYEVSVPASVSLLADF
nr:proline-rich receptor-like protein kinase PERK9 [Aegilops tauschii subsp. strangulata]